jgi:hypothetical protein
MLNPTEIKLLGSSNPQTSQKIPENKKDQNRSQAILKTFQSLKSQ